MMSATILGGGSVEIRNVAVADASAISTLLTQLGYPGTEGFIESKITHALLHPDAVLAVAMEGAAFLGFISLHFIPQVALLGDFCRISYFCVDEGARGRRVGKALEEFAVAEARARGCDRMELHCHSRRERAHQFYSRQGYEESPKYLTKLLT